MDEGRSVDYAEIQHRYKLVVRDKSLGALISADAGFHELDTRVLWVRRNEPRAMPLALPDH